MYILQLVVLSEHFKKIFFFLNRFESFVTLWFVCLFFGHIRKISAMIPFTLSFANWQMIMICISQHLWNKADSAVFHGCLNAHRCIQQRMGKLTLCFCLLHKSHFVGAMSPAFYSHACVCLHTAVGADGPTSSIFIDLSAVTLTLTPRSCPTLCEGSIEPLTAAAQPQSKPIIAEAGKDWEEASSCFPHASNLHSETHSLKERHWEWNICPVMGVS